LFSLSWFFGLASGSFES